MNWVRRGSSLFAMAAVSIAGAADIPTDATKSLLDARTGLKALYEGERPVAFYGSALAEDSNPATNTTQFVQNFLFTEGRKDAFGVDGVELVFKDKLDINNGKIVYTYTQEIDGVPVNGALVKILVLPGSTDKITYAGARLVKEPVNGFLPDTIDEMEARDIVSESPHYDHLTSFTVRELVIFEANPMATYRAWRFFGSNDNEVLLFFVDAASGEIVGVINAMLGIDAAGEIAGRTREYPGAMFAETGLARATVGAYVPIGPVSSCGVGNLIDEMTATTEGHFDFDNLPSPVRVKATLTNDVVTVMDYTSIFNPFLPALCRDTSSSVTDFDVVFNTSETEAETAWVNMFDGINQAHDFWKQIQPNSTAADVHVECRVNNGECGSALSSFSFSPPLSINFPGWINGNSCNNSAFSTLIFHEYMHIIQGQILGFLDAKLGSFAEGTAHVFAAFRWGTPLIGENIYTHGSTNPENWTDGYDIEPDVIVTDPGSQFCNINSNRYVCGNVLAGAFWAMRSNLIGDSEVQNPEELANQLFADFMLATDAEWDDSFVVELLAVDDNDGTFANLTPHWEHIASAFLDHGFFTTLCLEPNCSGVVVEWVGPLTPPSELDGDFAVNDSVVPPIVTLKRTEKGGAAVSRWRIGHASSQDIGAVFANWSDGPTSDVVIEIGTIPTAPVHNVNTVDVLPQSGAFYSGVLLQLAGDLGVRAQAYASQTCSGGANHGEECDISTDCPGGTCNRLGGRISGVIAGNVGFISAENIGDGGSSPGQLLVGDEGEGGIIESLELAALAAESVITGSRVVYELRSYGDVAGKIELAELRTDASVGGNGWVQIDGELEEQGQVIVGELEGTSRIIVEGESKGLIQAERMLPGFLNFRPTIRVGDLSGSIEIVDPATPVQGTIAVGTLDESAHVKSTGRITVVSPLGSTNSVIVHGNVINGGRVQLKKGLNNGSSATIAGDLAGTLEVGAPVVFGGSVSGTVTVSGSISGTISHYGLATSTGAFEVGSMVSGGKYNQTLTSPTGPWAGSLTVNGNMAGNLSFLTKLDEADVIVEGAMSGKIEIREMYDSNIALNTVNYCSNSTSGDLIIGAKNTVWQPDVNGFLNIGNIDIWGQLTSTGEVTFITCLPESPDEVDTIELLCLHRPNAGGLVRVLDCSIPGQPTLLTCPSSPDPCCGPGC